jgi:hypothetical protein
MGIDKGLFLEFLHAARKQAFTPTTIRNSWKAFGLVPLDPEVVLNRLPPNSTQNSEPQLPHCQAPLPRPRPL